MSGRSRDNRQLKLRREVEYPQRQSTGVGVMLVASAAMFFAVASSAFILRAQMPHQRCLHRVVPSEVQVADVVEVDLLDSMVDVETIETCGEPLYQDNPDGSISVFFDLCSPEE